MEIDIGAKEIIDRLHENGFEGYIVGGCVRDAVMGNKPKDWDITTDAKPTEIKKIFKKTIDTGIEHGTVTVRINKISYEVTTYRIDGEYKDCRRPKEVLFTSNIEKDLERRDFTMNSIAYNHTRGICDPFHGINDIENRIIRCVGNADTRFEEDALRIMRGLRFVSQLGFEIEKETLEAMKRKKALLNVISRERVRDELEKLLLGTYPAQALRIMAETGILEIIIPEAAEMIGFEQRNPNHNKDIFEHTLTVIEMSRKEKVSRLTALFHDIGKPECFSIDNEGVGHFYRHEDISSEKAKLIMKRLKYDIATIETVAKLIKEHLFSFEAVKTKAALKRLIARVGVENIYYLLDFKKADVLGTVRKERTAIIDKTGEEIKKILDAREPIEIKDLEIDGRVLLEMGYSGPMIGEILRSLKEQVIDNPEMNNREILINEAKEFGRKEGNKS